MISELAALYARDLDKVAAELKLYPDEASLWQVQPGISNPAGNLALHLVGNLSLFVGHNLGGVAYLRDRPAEFARRDVPRAELLTDLQATAEAVAKALAGLDDAALNQPYPLEVANFPAGMTTGSFLVHLYGHLNWHLGQINYHRRLLFPAS
ncbi:DinB family protein [Deinococcus sp.]|uniref:DinB family protein n=1 Tax=Deinococcus sp. TaxID=47478 RepID=UPI003CC6B18A